MIALGLVGQWVKMSLGWGFAKYLSIAELDRTGEFCKRSLKQYSFSELRAISVRFTFSETRQMRGTCRHQ